MEPDQCKDDFKREMDNRQFVGDLIPYCATIGIIRIGQYRKEMCLDTDEGIDGLETRNETVNQIRLENYRSEGMKERS